MLYKIISFDQNNEITKASHLLQEAKIILFDLDDTLYTPSPKLNEQIDYEEAFFILEYLHTKKIDSLKGKQKKAFREKNNERIKVLGENLRKIYGHGDNKTKDGKRINTSYLFQIHGIPKNIADGLIYKVFKNIDMTPFVIPNRKVVAYFKFLLNEGKTLGILTGDSYRNAIRKLKALGFSKIEIKKYISYIFTNDLGKREEFKKYNDLYANPGDKTTGAVFEVIKDYLQIHPSQIVYVGDNKVTDVELPHKAGYKTIYISNRGYIHPLADANIYSINSILD
ncbi:MAG: HAD hydrolase-like protein [Candidatus Margulisbacteria bacterium]|nr:HAD hydrolase-like protein [Candidatus Margulisiibacteriota bacterium]